MYRRPKFLEVLLEIRQEMARLADYDVDLFAEMARSGKGTKSNLAYSMREPDEENETSAKEKKMNRDDRKALRKA